MIISAAVKIKHENGINGELVIMCRRHHEAYKVLHTLCPGDMLHVGAQEGFINHRGEFLNRTDALQHALECGQLSAMDRHRKAQNGETKLYSEDLY